MGIRPERIAKELKRYISGILHRELKDPRIGFITITDVGVTPDLKSAKVFYSILGTRTERNNTINALKSASGFIRNLVGKHLELRYVPEIIFEEDKAHEHAHKIYKILDEIKNEEKNGSKKNQRKDTKKR